MPHRRLSTIPEQRDREELGDDVPSKDRSITITSLYYLFVILAIGIPVWYKLTTPVRFSLPDIPALMVHAQMMLHRVPVTVIVGENLDNLSIPALNQRLSSQWPRKVSADGSMSFVFDWEVRAATNDELDILSMPKEIDTIDEQLSSLPSPEGEIRVFLVDRKFGRDLLAVAGLSRNVFLTAASFSDDDDLLPEQIFSIIESVIESPSSNSPSGLTSVNQGKQITVEPPTDPHVSMLINFVMEDPMDGSSFQSNKLPAVQDLLETVLHSSGIQRLIDLRISSQMVYHAIDEIVLNSVLSNKQSKGSERLIDVQNLPLLTNSIENRVLVPGSNQTYHLNVIIPSSSMSNDLVFWDNSDESMSNILLTASKNSFLVWNRQDDFNLGFKLLIRKMIGLNQQMPNNLIRKDEFFADWELDNIKHSVCQKQILKTLSSLESIGKLLVKVGNIVIERQVSERMHEAVSFSHEAIKCLASGKLSQAYDHSCKAYELSESAFYDPSLLALLYFPDDQKYAVYFPLFLPVSLPLASSLYHLIRSTRRR